MLNKPIISIITVVYNTQDFLEKTILSVINQTYKNIEYIVIDGNSTDATMGIVEKYKDKITHIVSEEDDGIYDAMNKGIRLAKGDYINFMNAGDVLYTKDVLKNIIKKMDDKDTTYYTRANIISDSVGWTYPNYKTKDYQKWLKLNLPNHQSMFFPKSFYKNFFYDLRLKIGADDDYKLFALKKCKVKFIDEVFVEFKRDGISSSHKSFSLFKQRLKESFIRNYKHERYIRFIIDPFKLILMFLINFLFGEKRFLDFIKFIVKLKS